MTRAALKLLLLGVAGCGAGDESTAPAAPNLSVVVSWPAAGGLLWPLPAGEGQPVAVVINNTGTGSARAAVLDFSLPAGLVVSAWRCQAINAQCPAVVHSGSTTLPELPQGGELRFNADTFVPLGTDGELRVSASVTATGDSDASNNRAESTAAFFTADAAVNLAAPAAVTPGSTMTLTATVSSLGPSAAYYGITLALPAGLMVSARSCTDGFITNADCSSPAGSFRRTGGVAPGRPHRISFAVPVPASWAGDILASAVLSPMADPNTANNASGAVAPVLVTPGP